uniref:Uncharacterized protein n=1 Tax=Arundo donax TaxID=35708 RepID=A0A0A9HDT7_ARUDO
MEGEQLPVPAESLQRHLARTLHTDVDGLDRLPDLLRCLLHR